MTCVIEEGMVGDVKKRPFSILTYVHFGGRYHSFFLWWRNLSKITLISLKLVSKSLKMGFEGISLKAFINKI